MENSLNYLKGDATEPQGQGKKIIVHICNDIGAWGAGFVLALSRKWSEPQSEYKNWFRSGKDFELGEVQFVKVEEDIFVANMIAQRGLVPDEYGPPVRYEAIVTGLHRVAKKAMELDASLHMPRIGSGLAGGDWNMIEKIIKRTLADKGLHVTVYDLK